MLGKTKQKRSKLRKNQIQRNALSSTKKMYIEIKLFI